MKRAKQGGPVLPAVLITSSQCADLLGISRRTWFRLVEAGEAPPPCWRASRKMVRWSRAEVMAWLERKQGRGEA